MIKYSQEKIIDVYDDILPILRDHFSEVGHYQDIRLEPNISEYYSLEKSGNLKLYIARDDFDKELIGYAIFIIRPHLHYKSCLTAGQDIIYIKKERRGFGEEFINWCDMQLKKLGVQVVYHHVKVRHDFSPALKRLGYEGIEKIWGRRLDKL